MADNKNAEQAKKIFAENKGVKQLWANKKGEFFTNENLAKNSVKDPKELESFERKDVKADDKAAEAKVAAEAKAAAEAKVAAEAKAAAEAKVAAEAKAAAEANKSK